MAAFSWLHRWRKAQRPGSLVAIFVAGRAGEPMRRVATAQALAGQGLDGDRYAAGAGHWRHTDACEVTLVTKHDLRRATRASGIAFGAGEHRRNLVVEGIPLDAFRGRRVRIGEALFVFHRLRPPCGYLDRLLQRGAGKALGRGAGIGLKVLRSGRLRQGDAVEVLDPAKPGSATGKRDA